MKNLKRATFGLSLIALLCLQGCGGDFGSGKHTIKGTVLEVGPCGGNEGFFSGPYECAVKVDFSGTIQYTIAWDKVMVGQTVYKHCWMEDGSSVCFANVDTHIWKSYRT